MSKPGTTYTDAREAREEMAAMMRARTDEPLRGSYKKERFNEDPAPYYCAFGLCLQSMIDESPNHLEWEYEWYENGGRSTTPVGITDNKREHSYNHYDAGEYLGLTAGGVDVIVSCNDDECYSWSELADLLMEQEYFVIEGA